MARTVAELREVLKSYVTDGPHRTPGMAPMSKAEPPPLRTLAPRADGKPHTLHVWPGNMPDPRPGPRASYRVPNSQRQRMSTAAVITSANNRVPKPQRPPINLGRDNVLSFGEQVIIGGERSGNRANAARHKRAS